MKHSTKNSIVFWFALIGSISSFVVLAVSLSADAYVRWNLNADFTFLSDFGTLALAIAWTGQVMTLLFTLRAEK